MDTTRYSKWGGSSEEVPGGHWGRRVHWSGRPLFLALAVLVATVLWAVILSILLSKGERPSMGKRCVRPPWGHKTPVSWRTNCALASCSLSECEQSVCTSSGRVHSRVCTWRARMCASPRAFVRHRLVCTSCALYDCRLAPWFRVGGPRTPRARGGFPSPWLCLQEPLSAAFTERAALLGCQDLLRTNGACRAGRLGPRALRGRSV
uniref:Uncharacterized protein n=1 Tax=Macaca fascicularis TaxID=9541 RepID=A0A7N9IET4_MACFA